MKSNNRQTDSVPAPSDFELERQNLAYVVDQERQHWKGQLDDADQRIIAMSERQAKLEALVVRFLVELDNILKETPEEFVYWFDDLGWKNLVELCEAVDFPKDTIGASR